MFGVVNDAELNKIIEEVDMNGFIEYEEFLRVTINKSQIISENNLKIAFDKFDTNGDGSLSIEEIKNIFGTSDNDYIIELITKIDENNDGCISFTEFSIMMRNMLQSEKKYKRSLKTYLPTNTILNFDCLENLSLDDKGKALINKQSRKSGNIGQYDQTKSKTEKYETRGDI